MKKSITFLMPQSGYKPAGGFKVVYEYANRLASDGIDVHIVYPTSIGFTKLSTIQKIKSIVRYPYWHIKGFYGKNWFRLNPSIHHHVVLSLNQIHVPKSDYYVATALKTAEYLHKYKIDNSRKLYLIQGFENWGVRDEDVYQTYHYGFKNIVISGWLKELVEKSGAPCTLIPNGFDFKYFTCDIPIEKKDRYKISMLYHQDELKGCKYGIKALEIVKNKHPELRAMFFGVPTRPENLPEWIEYYQMPDRDTHNRLYNECAINLAPSLQEGWGLTVGEAMICGEAVVCTDALGFKEMVEDGENGFIVPKASAEALADKIELLLQNDMLRQEIATKGHLDIQRFSWDDSYQKFRGLIDL